jgi:acetyl esterase
MGGGTRDGAECRAARIIVAGDSAGGTLAAATSLRLRDEDGPPLCGQLLLYPVTDYHTPGTPSYEDNAEGYGLTRDTMKWFWDHYLNDPSEASNPYAAPLRARDRSGLPPALVITAEYDPLRDEGERYAERLRGAGVHTTLSRYDGMNHGFLFWVGLVDKAGYAMAEACAWMREAFQAGAINKGC